MEPTTLTEWGPPELVDLPSAIAHELRRRGVVDVRPTEQSGRWELRASRWVGVTTVRHHGHHWQLTVQPKLSVNRIAFMLGYTRRPDIWSTDRVQIDDASDLAEALAHAFCRLATDALAQGVLKGYRTVESSLPVLRGRLREADQVRRQWGMALPLEVRYDDFTVDIPENQILLAAAQSLLRNPSVSATARPSLHRLRVLLADVTAPTRGHKPPTWRPTRLNARYCAALTLAGMILDCRSFQQRTGTVEMTGFLVDMDKVFEDFVCVGLSEALRPRQTHLQYRSHFDEASHVPIRPDFVWTEHGIPRAVADAKYKSGDMGSSDLYQLFAYCKRLDVPSGHIINAGGAPAEPYELPGGVRVFIHSLALDSSPDELLAQLGSIASQMCASGLTPSVSSRESGSRPVARMQREED